MWGVLFAIGFFIFIGIGYWWTGVLEKRRREDLIRLAQELGLELSWQLMPGDQNRFDRFVLSKKGYRRKSGICLTAETDQTRMTIFDFDFETGQGKNKEIAHFVFTMCIDSQLQAPQLSLRPSTWGARLAEFVGRRDIDFPEDPEFSKTFVLRGPDEEAIKRFFTPSRRRAMLAYPEQNLEICDNTILIVRRNTRLDAKMVKSYMNETLRITRALVGSS